MDVRSGTPEALHDPLERASLLLELGRLAEAEGVSELEAGDAHDTALMRARVAAWRGDFLAALRLLEDLAERALGDRAQVLAVLGRLDEALTLLEGQAEPELRLMRARLHLLAGEAAAASFEMPDAPGSQAFGAELALMRGEILTQSSESRQALAPLRRACRLAEQLERTSLLATALSRLGEAHADAGNRWRALRAVTRAQDLVGSGKVAAWLWAGIGYRAFVVYGMYGHRDRAEEALQRTHQQIIQLASGIEERAYRETFLIDNPDCQRVIGCWKGEAGWGMDVHRH